LLPSYIISYIYRDSKEEEKVCSEVEIRRMPSSAMSSGLFVESASGSGAEPVLCAPRPRRVQQVHPCSADLILGPPPFPRNANSKVRTRSLVAPLPPSSCCSPSLTKPCSSSLSLQASGSSSREGGRKTTRPAAEDEDCRWAAFGGSPPARADNPLVHDPRFLRNQRHPAPLELGLPNHRRPTYSSGGDGSGFASSSFAPAVRIQGFDVAACRA